MHDMAVGMMRNLEYRSFTKADVADCREAMKKLAANGSFWAKLEAYGELMSKANAIRGKITGHKRPRRSFRRRIRG